VNRQVAKAIAWALAALLLVLPLTPLIPEFWVTLLILIGLASLTALGLVVLTGMGGMTSFGQAAFVGFGAYTTGLLSTTFGLSPWLGLPAALIVTGFAACCLGAITVRLSGHYLPLGTLAWGISIFYIFGNSAFLGGQTGMTGIPPLKIGPLTLLSARSYYVLVWIAVVLSILATINLLDSRVGRAFRALRRNAIAAEAFGVQTARAKLVVFVYAALLAGLAGWLYAHFQRTLSASAFGTEANIDYLLMAIVGGVGQVFGALLGAGIVIVLKDLLQDVLGRLGMFQDLLFGIMLVGILQYSREGVWPLVSFWLPATAMRKIDPAADVEVAVRPPNAAVGPLLALDKARKTFGGLVAVDDVSFTVDEAETVALIGPNGAGKSTLFDLMTGVRRATAGRVLFDGEPIERLAPQAIARRGIARTFQHVRLVPELSVIENVTLGAHSRGKAGVMSAILRLDRAEERRLFAHAARRLERVGLAKEMFRPAGHLSLGQMRLVEVARALCLDPRLLLLDEPAAGLRAAEKQALAKLLRELKGEGISILVVEHDVDFVMGLAERIVVLDFGKKIAEGPPPDIRVNPVVIEAYLGGVA
jgi:branched-chain amino acid transport system ATP-binding protein/branched-chain amino acid transport system permease protein